MPYWVDLSEHKISLNVSNSPDGKRLILRPLSPDAPIPAEVSELGFEKRGDIYERQDLQFTLPQIRKYFPKAVSRNFPVADIFFTIDRIERYQWKKNSSGGQPFGNRYEIRPIASDIFDAYIRPLLRDDYANSLSEYLEKHPEITHASFVQVAGAGDWQLDQVGSLDSCRPTPANLSWVIKVDDFFSDEATNFGNTADDVDNPKYRDGRTIPVIGNEVFDLRGGFGGGSIRLDGKVISRSNTLRVQITATTGLVAASLTESIEPLSDGWTIKGEEHPNERQARESQERAGQLMQNNIRTPWHVTRAVFLDAAQFDISAAGPQITFDGQTYPAKETSPRKAKEEVHERLVKEALQGKAGQSLPTFDVLLDYPGIIYPVNLRAEKNVSRLLSQLSIGTKLLAGEDAYYRVENQPYMDLVIERLPHGDGDRLYFTHYYKSNGDSIMDAEMVFDIRQNGALRLAETASQNPIQGGELRNRDVSFANMFSKNLLDQGFGKAKGYWPNEERDMDPLIPNEKLELAMEIVEKIAIELDVHLSGWEKSDESIIGEWRYSIMSANDIEIKIAVSQGGVVQVNGDPFTKDVRAVHDNYEAIISSIRLALPSNSNAQYPVVSAYEYGVQAFNKGKPCTPALDADFMATISGEVGSNLDRLNDWHKGWARANLNVPVPEPEIQVNVYGEDQNAVRETEVYLDGFRHFSPLFNDRSALQEAMQTFINNEVHPTKYKSPGLLNFSIPEEMSFNVDGDKLSISVGRYTYIINAVKPAPEFTADKPWMLEQYKHMAPLSMVSSISACANWINENVNWDKKKASYPDGGHQIEKLARDYASMLKEAMPEHHSDTVAEMHRSFAIAIMDKDVDYLLGWIARARGQNDTSKKFFTQATSCKLPKTIKDITATIYAWAGYTPEEAIAREQKKDQDRDARIQASNAESQIKWVSNTLSNKNVKHNDVIKSCKQFLDDIMAEGFTSLEKRQSGAVHRYQLVNRDNGHLYKIKGDMVDYVKHVLAKKEEEPENVPALRF